jgi:hypothetical protein
MSETKTAETTTSKNSTANRGAATARKPGRRTRAAVPWIEGGIDYGPALVAIEELIAWAFDLAATQVADWPEGKRRVRNARRIVANAIRGKRTRQTLRSEDDVVFTASLLIRIFDGDLGLGLGDIVEVLSELGLPTFEVPHSARPTARGARVPQPTTADLAALVDAIQRGATPAPVVPLRRPTRATRPAVVSAMPCAGCCLARPGLAVAA